jgi:hypothetical protein
MFLVSRVHGTVRTSGGTNGTRNFDGIMGIGQYGGLARIHSHLALLVPSPIADIGNGRWD